jgi:hypothetical protein
MNNALNRLAIVGLGNVGYWTTIGLGPVILGSPPGTEWDVAVIDFDSVDDRAVRKGFPPRFNGSRKPQAMVAAIDAMYGVRVAASMHPVLAAAQSVPGLFADRDVMICVDSLGDAQIVSNLARAHWQCRVSTGSGELATHCIEVFPPNTAALGDIYDEAAWSLAARRQGCMTGEPARPLDGAAHPIGIVTGALALQAYLNRANDTVPYRLQCTGTQPIRSELLGPARAMNPRRDLDIDNRATIDRVWTDVARDLEVDQDELMITWDVPFVRRHCACGVYFGFERYPTTGRCATCGSRSILIAGRREMLPGEANPIRRRTLRSLHAPAGVGFFALTSDGRRRVYRLAYRQDDVPPLQESGIGHLVTRPMEELHP